MIPVYSLRARHMKWFLRFHEQLTRARARDIPEPTVPVLISMDFRTSMARLDVA